MKLAIMQPYFFPYIGYWQLIKAADRFIILDDVNYIQRGWIGRNRILCDGKEHLLINPVKKRSQNKKINQTEFINDSDYMANMVKTIEYAYRKAPYLDKTIRMLSNIILNNEPNVPLYLAHQIETLCHYLDIHTEIGFASQYRTLSSNSGQEGILDLCQYLECDEYLNPVGGLKLYDREYFSKSGVRIHFLKTDFEKMSSVLHIGNLDYSIIHLIVNCTKEDLQATLLDYYYV